MYREKRIYVFDFDGVICDSRPECMITSYNAYRFMHDAAFTLNFCSEVVSKDWQERFFEYRFLCRVACEYMLLWDMITSEEVISSVIPISQQVESSKDRIGRYNDLFFEVRKEWMRENIESWLNYNPLYDGVCQILKRWIAENRLLIVSAKDKVSIITILKFAGISISENAVLGNEGGDKPCHFNRICQQYQNSDIVFIDDNLENLLMLRNFDITLYLAVWGYNNEQCIDGALRNGIKPLTLKVIKQME